VQTQKSRNTSYGQLHWAQAQVSPITISDWLLALGLLLTGVGGAFLPWIWRESVALQLTAPGLAEFVKFLPQVRAGQVEIERLFFLLPLFLAMLALPLFSVNRDLQLPGWFGWLMRLVVIPLALAALSPVWTPAILIAPEFRLQTLLAVVAIGLSLGAPLLKWLPLKPLVILLIGAGVAALILPYWHFSLIRADVVEAYQQPVSLGWGWWVTAGAIIVSIIGAAWTAFFPVNHG
jgi:hypothetical protein